MPEAPTPPPPLASGTRVLVASQTVSAAQATVNLWFNAASGGYDIYEVEYYGIQVSALAQMMVRFSTDGSTWDATTNYVQSQVISNSTTTATASAGYATTSSIQMTGNVDASSTQATVQGKIRLHNAGMTGRLKMILNRSGGYTSSRYQRWRIYCFNKDAF